MRIGYVQTRPVLGEVGRNIDEVLDIIGDIHADLIVLPELFNTGYSLSRTELVDLAEEVPDGRTLAALQEISSQKDRAIVAGFAERASEKFYNSSALITPEGIKVHRKVHLFDREKKIFSPGSSFDVHSWRGAKIGMMVCFDWFFPESCRTLMLKGAEIIAHPANLVLPFWPTAALVRAIENHVFIVTASRVGSERGLDFVGGSLIVSPKGNVLSRAGNSCIEKSVVKVDTSSARDKKVTGLNDILEDRRPTAYRLD